MLDAEGVAEPGDDLGGQERVAAELEEVVVDADAVALEQLAPRSARRALSAGVRGATYGSPAASALRLGSGQGVAVDLAVGRQRQGVEHDEGRGDHVLGQRLLEPASRSSAAVARAGVAATR